MSDHTSSLYTFLKELYRKNPSESLTREHKLAILTYLNINFFSKSILMTIDDYWQSIQKKNDDIQVAKLKSDLNKAYQLKIIRADDKIKTYLRAQIEIKKKCVRTDSDDNQLIVLKKLVKKLKIRVVECELCLAKLRR